MNKAINAIFGWIYKDPSKALVKQLLIYYITLFILILLPGSPDLKLILIVSMSLAFIYLDSSARGCTRLFTLLGLLGPLGLAIYCAVRKKALGEYLIYPSNNILLLLICLDLLVAPLEFFSAVRGFGLALVFNDFINNNELLNYIYSIGSFELITLPLLNLALMVLIPILIVTSKDLPKATDPLNVSTRLSSNNIAYFKFDWLKSKISILTIPSKLIWLKNKLIQRVIIAVLICGCLFYLIRGNDYFLNFKNNLFASEAAIHKATRKNYSPLLLDDVSHSSRAGNIVLRFMTNSGLKAFKAQRYKEALGYLLIPANFNDTEAQYALGLLYANGLGVKSNLAKAERYLKLAADLKHGPSQYATSIFYNYFAEVVTDDIEALGIYYIRDQYLIQSAENGYAKGQFTLGSFYERGEILYEAKDINKAIYWYELSAKQGYKPAIDALERIRGNFARAESARQIQLTQEAQIQAQLLATQNEEVAKEEKRTKRKKLAGQVAGTLLGIGAIAAQMLY